MFGHNTFMNKIVFCIAFKAQPNFYLFTYYLSDCIMVLNLFNINNVISSLLNKFKDSNALFKFITSTLKIYVKNK